MNQKAAARIAQQRLRNQHIAAQAFDKPGDLVRWFGAVQAQDYYEALWAIGLRTKHAVVATVERGIAERDVVRTWPLRGTLHFVARDDVRWMLRHFAPKVVAAAAARYRAHALDPDVFARAERVCVRLLDGGRVETRATIYAALEQAGIATTKSRGMHIMWHLAHIGLICYGPRAGKQPTFTLLDEWVPNARVMDRPAALGELAHRYFRSHGPAQLADFAWWGGLTLSDARLGIEAAEANLTRATIAGATHWLGERPAAGRKATSRSVHLLPVLDEYTVAYRDRRAIIDPRHTLRVNAGGGLIKPIIVIDGQVVGTWRRAIRRNGIAITTTPFFRLSRKHQGQLDEAAERYARFLGLERVDA